MSYTPGPWQVSGSHRKGYDISHDEHRGPAFLAVVHPLTEWPKEDAEARANAYLIGAAPDLYEALVGLNHMGGDERGGYCICPRSDGSAPDDQHSSNCESARRAIAKAEGSEAKGAHITEGGVKMNPKRALQAILARVRGEFDHPALTEFGPLSDTISDVTLIAEAVLADKTSQQVTP